MARLFIGIDLPPAVDDHLELMSDGMFGARWEGVDKFHLTLRFLDEVDGRIQREVIDALQEINTPAFAMQLKGIGTFPPRGLPTSVWAGVAEPGPVTALKQRVDALLRKVHGIPPDPRKFAPHVTIARVGDVPVEEVMQYVAAHALFRSEVFMVEHVFLYSSVRSPKGSSYRIEAGFPLRTAG